MNTLITPDALVAFVDVLGFKDRIMSATGENLDSIHEEMKSLHGIFEVKPKNPETTELHKVMGKSIVSFSDSIIVSISLKSDFAEFSDRLDVQAVLLNELAFNQALAVMQGTFVRGGIALGYYCADDDIILSNALIKAYTAETEACMPIIALDKDFSERFIRDPHNKCYRLEDAPFKNLLASFSNPGTGQLIHFLDYFHAASGNDFGEEFLIAHAQKIQSALAYKYPPAVRAKYEWLAKYHNDSLERMGLDSSFRVNGNDIVGHSGVTWQ